jgi:hypothetical protein
MRPLTDREIEAIRERRGDISRQLTSAVERREELAGELRGAPPETHQGLLDRIQQLDQRIMQIEADMETSGAMLRTGLAPEALVLVPPDQGFASRLSEETITILGVSFSVFFLLPLALGVMRLMFRRSKRATAVATSPEQAARMERLEQAVDAVAIEIERVGESQRFQAKVLTEANLMPAVAAGQGAAEPPRVRDYEASRAKYQG